MRKNESYEGRIGRKLQKKTKIINVANGNNPADLVLKNASYVNVFTNDIRRGDIAICEGVIVGIGQYRGIREIDVSDSLVLPGFIDAHVHLESAMVSPCQFVKAVLPHGTTTVITDPHEIANVMGTDGIEYMLQATEGLPVDVRFMLPSCVPATPMDESGAVLDYRAIDSFYDHPRVQGLAEVMNFPGGIGADADVIKKIIAAQAHHKKIDGHAPGLDATQLNAYITGGIYSDHECYDLADALSKLERGQFIMIREGTAAHNLQALLPLLNQQYSDRCMFCCDDKHPSDLLHVGHIDYIVKEAIRQGVDPVIAVKVASHNAARYLALNNRGAIAPGYLADIVIIDNFESFHIQQVFKKGVCYYENGVMAEVATPVIDAYLSEKAHHTFHMAHLEPHHFAEDRPRSVIGIVPGELVTKDCGYSSEINVEKDILKIAVVERHKNTNHIGLGYLNGYGLKSGAVATSISHDSHNLIVVGTNEEDMAVAANFVAENHGGIVVVDHGKVVAEVILNVAGLISDDTLEAVNDRLENAKAAAFRLGVGRNIDPFMTLSFMSLPVIPTIRLTTRGVIDVMSQRYQ